MKGYTVKAMATMMIIFISLAVFLCHATTREHQEITRNTIEQSIEVRLNNLQKQIDIYAKKEVINDAKRQIDILEERIASLNRDKLIEKKISILPNLIKIEKRKLEVTLQQVNIMIHNTTAETLGSGVTIKYNGKYYILTAGHMADSLDDNLELWENKMKICDLKIIKQNYTLNNATTDKELYKTNDLLLLAPINEDIVPNIWTELADNEPIIGTDIYIVGNPMGIEDVISEGRVLKYTDNFMYISDNIYFGNSGGGVYTKDGLLVGIVSHLFPYQPNEKIIPWMTYGIVRFNALKEFLQGV